MFLQVHLYLVWKRKKWVEKMWKYFSKDKTRKSGLIKMNTAVIEVHYN